MRVGRERPVRSVDRGRRRPAIARSGLETLVSGIPQQALAGAQSTPQRPIAAEAVGDVRERLADGRASDPAVSLLRRHTAEAEKPEE